MHATRCSACSHVTGQQQGQVQLGAVQAVRQTLGRTHPDGLHVGLLVGRHVLLQAQQSTLSHSRRSKQVTRCRSPSLCV